MALIECDVWNTYFIVRVRETATHLNLKFNYMLHDVHMCLPVFAQKN